MEGFSQKYLTQPKAAYPLPTRKLFLNSIDVKHFWQFDGWPHRLNIIVHYSVWVCERQWTEQ